LLVLDEPTAVLTPQEVDELFVILRGMCERGRALIFISHKLHEVMELSDRITVLRDGRVVGETTPDQTSPEGLAQMMVGRPVKMAPDKEDVEPGAPLLAIEGLTVRGDRDQVAVDGVDLEVRSGEILGIAGVSGNGQRELAEAIAGLREVESGRIELVGHDVTGAEPRAVREAGLSYVPEERMKEGAVGDFTVAENLMLLNHAEEQYCRHGVLRFGPMREHCSELVRSYRVKTPSLNTTVKSLSGGNIQKLILARELAAAPKVLLAAQPTRGVDIGAAEYIHDQLVKRRTEGMGILLISEDLDEVLGLSDRIAVMFEGRIVGIVDRAGAKVEELGLLMAGSTASA
ncbi:MAG TPA: ATP-binding cassette domain-containing protein, partial [Acidimicrobiales bacterium]|nr:ATP-binding cassette domain-containing protein [Acidimicrobiales bacterium]